MEHTHSSHIQISSKSARQVCPSFTFVRSLQLKELGLLATMRYLLNLWKVVFRGNQSMKSMATDDPHWTSYKMLQASTSIYKPFAHADVMLFKSFDSQTIVQPGSKHVQACVTIVGMLLYAGRNWGLFSEYWLRALWWCKGGSIGWGARLRWNFRRDLQTSLWIDVECWSTFAWMEVKGSSTILSEWFALEYDLIYNI